MSAIFDAGSLTILLRRPAEVARRCREQEALRALAPVALVCLVGGAALFGAVLGAHRGGAQILFAGMKMPLALTAALVVAVPAFHAVSAILGRPVAFRSMVALALAAAGRAGLTLAAAAPLLWLLSDLGLGYHGMVLLATLAYGVAGVTALGVLLRGVGQGKYGALVGLVCVGIFLAASAQTGWLLRPYLVRPQEEGTPFLRAREGGVGDALGRSARSAIGIYDREAATIRDETWRGTPETREIQPSGEVPASFDDRSYR